MEIISLDEALRILQQTGPDGAPVPFSITAVTCSLQRNKGGERLTYQKAVVCSKVTKTKDFNIKGDGTKEPRSISPLLITHINGKEVTI